MRLNRNDYRSKVLGCWLGKNIGGTVGAPFEWKRQVNDISFYVQDLQGKALPNDDLDIQLLWLVAMEEKGLDVTAHRLADYWCRFVTPHWAEYGNAKINMRQGVLPPLSGSMRNEYKHSCGAFIRSEIWACIAPGMPGVAAHLALRDAILDHGDGEGTHAEIFMAALESAAFIVSDLRTLIDIGLSYIPADCGVAKAVHTTLACFDAGKSWLETRDEILRLHRGRPAPWMGPLSERDRALGFDTGELGYDVPSNIAITLLGLLWGGEDFGKVMCITVNCGEDTDCTAATAGSIWGIIRGHQAIPQKWIDPIGRDIVTIALNLGELWHLPRNVDNLTDRTEKLARQMLIRHNAEHLWSDQPTDLSDVNPAALRCSDLPVLQSLAQGQWFQFDFFGVHVNYGDGGAALRDGHPKTVMFTVRSLWGQQSLLNLRWYLPEGLRVAPVRQGTLSIPAFHDTATATFELTCDEMRDPTMRAVLEITIDGRPTVMLVPVMLTNGNL